MAHLRQTCHLGSLRIIWYLSRHHDIKISDAGVYVRQSFVSVYESGLRAILSLPIALRYLLSMFDPLARVTYSQILSAHQEEAKQEKALIGRDILGQCILVYNGATNMFSLSY